ncbi:MAG: biopolymer transporter ExbD [Phycisphaerae bacterium]|nr:biopolymer transporter ExbD [Phycisphaerae bacterium]
MSASRGSPARRRATAGAASLSLNMTPMIDVTFQLLIYFLLGTSFVLGEEIYRVDLPDRTERRERGEGTGEDPIVIRIRSQSAELNDYRVDLEGPLSTLPTDRSLAEGLRASIVSAENPNGLVSRRTPVVIAPSADTRWEHAVDVFDAAVKAGFNRVAFAPTSKDAPR